MVERGPLDSLEILFKISGRPMYEGDPQQFANGLVVKFLLIHGMTSCSLCIIEGCRLLPNIFTSSEAFVVGITCLVQFTKLCFMTLRNSHLQSAFTELNEQLMKQIRYQPWTKPLLFKSGKTIEFVKNLFFFMFAGTILASGFAPLFVLVWSNFKIKNYPLRMWVPVPETWIGYGIKYGFEMFLNFGGTITFTICYTTFIALIIHICCQMDILTKDITETKEVMEGDEFIESLPRWVDHHALIIRLVEKTNLVFAEALILEIVFSSIQSCLVLFQLSKRPLSDPSQMFFMMFLICATVMPLSICWCGQEFQNKSSKFRDSLYSFLWYEIPPAHRKSLVTLQMIANKPRSLNAHLLVINLVTFAKVLQSSYSYFTLLRTMDK